MPDEIYYKQDPAKYREQTRQWQERNREKVRANNRKYHEENRARLNAARRERYYKERDAARAEGRVYGTEASRRNVLKQYGLTEDKFTCMSSEQGNVCFICGEPNNKRNLVVDHDHATGAVRKLLCTHCNLGVGYLEHPKRRLWDAYLEQQRDA